MVTHLCISVAVYRQLWANYAPLSGESEQGYPTDTGDGRGLRSWGGCSAGCKLRLNISPVYYGDGHRPQLDGSDLVALHQQGLFYFINFYKDRGETMKELSGQIRNQDASIYQSLLRT